MRIAQIAPLMESVPPKEYGGTERVVHFLTEELVRLGHDVTLFASGDSVTSAKLVPCCETSLRLNAAVKDQLAYHIAMLEDVFSNAASFDALHFHIDYLHFPLSKRQRTPALTTLHGRLDLPELQPLYRKFSGMPLVSISDAQRAPLPRANWVKTIYHGLPENLLQFHRNSGSYLAFVGRISPEKRVDHAIEIAARGGVHLKVAAKIDPNEKDYYRTVIAPLFRKYRKHVEFVGEIGEKEKDEFMGNALALLFPIDWPEPFGLVVIEAMACGTPVIARRRGSVPELVEDGVTGLIYDEIEEGIKAVHAIGNIDRLSCREAFLRRFSSTRMAEEYIHVYQQLIQMSYQGTHAQKSIGHRISTS